MTYLYILLACLFLLMLGCSGEGIVDVEEQKIVPTLEVKEVGAPTVSDVAISIVLPPGVDLIDPVLLVDELVVFLAEVTGGAGTLSLEWNFGDGTVIVDGFLIDHIYTFSGTFTVSVLVTDTVDGVVVGTVSDSFTLTVIGSPPSPEELMQDLIDAMDDLTFITPQAHNAMVNKLHALQKQILEGNYAEALDKLQNDIAPKLMLGDKHSWITAGDVSDIIADLLDVLA